MTFRRRLSGMTLIEVLIATAILAVIAAAAIPLIQSIASAARDRPTAPPSLTQLSRLADQVVATPGKFGFRAGAPVPLSVPWPEDPARTRAELRQLPGAGPEPVQPTLAGKPTIPAAGVWVCFREGERFAIRWIDVPVKVSP